MTQIAQGLADAQTAGVVHRDIKPSNVLIGSDGIARLSDFGIAKALDLTRFTATSTVLGTPAYMAPEGTKDTRSDLYGLGVIGYELLTGAAPFKGTTYQDIIVEHIRTAPDLGKLPREARPIIGWLLAKEPGERPQRASDLVNALVTGAVPQAALAAAAEGKRGVKLPAAGATPAKPAGKANETSWFCTDCGTRMPAGTVFCNKCGNALRGPLRGAGSYVPAMPPQVVQAARSRLSRPLHSHSRAPCCRPAAKPEPGSRFWPCLGAAS